MGREAACKCQWSGHTAHVKALLETSEIVLRGEMRKRVPFAEIRDIAVQGEALRFSAGGELVSLSLGAEVAAKWAHAIKSPPSLAQKLGISSKSVVHVIGNIADEALRAAIAEAGRTSTLEGTLIVALVDTTESLNKALLEAKRELQSGIPIWLVYRKGPGHPLSESKIRSALLAAGMVDTKVASVSALFTAMRFNRRKA